MNTLVTTTTAADGIGAPSGAKLLRVKTGQFAGRMALIYMTTPTTLVFSWADAPWTTWSSATTISTIAESKHFDAVMDANGNIYVAYSREASHNLSFRILTFSSGAWTVGVEAVIRPFADCTHPSIVLQAPSRLWIFYTAYENLTYLVYAQKSEDLGVNWDTNPGATISETGSSAFAKGVIAGDYVYALFTVGGTKLAARRRHTSGSVFDSETVLASGAGFDDHFHAAVSADTRIGVVYDNAGLKFREFDGISWSATITLDSVECAYPRVKYTSNTPYVIYRKDSGVNGHRLAFVDRTTGVFSAPQDIHARRGLFAKVLLFANATGVYRDLTTAAGNATSGDILHADTGAALKSAGDAMYLGLSEKFSYARAALSVFGAGGTVAWQYFNGIAWVTFTPSNGAYNLESDRDIQLWSGESAAPVDWQRTAVSGNTLFFVRAVVVTPFTTSPIGTLLTGYRTTNAFITEEG